jgi:hypothetical protein
MKTSLKDWRKVYRKLGCFAHMSDGEKVQFARALAATPDERWEMNVNSLKALGLLGGVRSCRELERRKAKLRRVEKAVLWKTRLSNEERAKGRML